VAIELPVVGDQSVIKQFDEILQRVSLGPTSGVKAGNFDGQWIEFTSSATPDAENTVEHDLDRIPTGYIVGQRNKAGVLYNGTTTWTSSNIYLKCNVASTAFRIFVW
jgi:hypothetical protein